MRGITDIEYKRGIIASAHVIDRAEEYPIEDVLDAVLRINHLENANSVSKETFRKALRIVLNIAWR